MKRSINAFISSANRAGNESSYDFTVEFPDDMITCSEQEYIQINVSSFDMLNTMYNINDTNNTFNILMDDIPFTYRIPEGNYSVRTLQTWLSQTLTFLVVNYNAAQNTWSIARKEDGEVLFNYAIVPLTSGKFFGLLNGTKYDLDDVGITTSYINLVNYNKIIIRTQNVNYDMNTIENLKSSGNNKLAFSDILFWKSKHDIEPFQNISYSNEDSGNSFNLSLQDKYVSNMRLQMKNENAEFIVDAPDYLIVLQFNIYQKMDYIKNSMVSISQNLRDIWVVFLFVMEKLKLLN